MEDKERKLREKHITSAEHSTPLAFGEGHGGEAAPAVHSTPLSLGEGIGGEAAPAEHSTPLAFGEGHGGEAAPAEHSTPLSLGEGIGGEAARGEANKINQLFSTRGDRKLLSLYFCAGCPTLEGTADVILAMQRHGIDMIEVGIPFSDPLADGPVIQSAGTVALKNGTTLKKIFAQLKAIKDQVTIPLVMMGYLNVIMHYGLEDFFRSCVESGASGCIIPDLPFKDYMDVVKPIADKYDIRVIMMITPETSEERIRFIDEHTDGFIYIVSSASITGAQSNFGEAKQAYFRHINSMNLHNPRMIGFGISNKQTLESAQQNAAGAIIGSKFVTLLNETKDPDRALDLLFDALEQPHPLTPSPRKRGVIC